MNEMSETETLRMYTAGGRVVAHAAQFANVPHIDIYDIPFNQFHEARWIPGYLRHKHMQPVSNREKAWSGCGILCVPRPSDAEISFEQLAIRVQLREGYLVSRAGGKPPKPCDNCLRTDRSHVWEECISGGHPPLQKLGEWSGAGHQRLY